MNLQRLAGNRAVVDLLGKTDDARQRPSARRTRSLPVVQRVSTTDCNDDQKAELETAVAKAQDMVAKALRLLGKSASDPDTPAVKASLNKFFGDDGIGTYLKVISGFKELEKGIAEDTTYECENAGTFMYDHFCEGNSAYVRHPIVAMNIHMCDNAFGNSTELAATVVHENSHFWGWTDDEQYCPAGCTLDKYDAYDNADSFAMFAREVYLKL